MLLHVEECGEIIHLVKFTKKNYFVNFLKKYYLTLFYLLSGGSPKNRQKTQKKHDHPNKQQAVATLIPTQFKKKLKKILI